MQFNFATTMSFASAAACLSVAAMSARLARGPSSAHFRHAAAAATAAAVYSLTDAMLAARMSVAVTVWAGRLGLAAACVHGVAWLYFLAEWDRRKLSRVERVAAVASVVGAFVALVPGVGAHSTVTPRTVAWLGVTYQDPDPGYAGSLIMSVAYASQILAARAAFITSRRIPRARVVAAAFAVLCIAALGDWMSAVHVVDLPYLADVALALVPLAVASTVAADASDNAKKLVLQSAELERARVKLVERERLAALGQLGAVVAHEVRNPVAIIFNAISALRRRSRDADDEQLLSIIEQESSRLKRMVGQLLDVVRPFELQYRRRTLSDLVAEAVTLATSADANAAAQVDTQNVPAEPLDCDDVLLGQALGNLISNAIEAPGRQAPVRVSAALDVNPPGTIRVEVMDDGEGVAAEDRSKLFTPFFTTRATGTGLGLTVVKRIAEAHGGSVEHVGVDGGGTRFVLRVPVRRPESQDVPATRTS